MTTDRTIDMVKGSADSNSPEPTVTPSRKELRLIFGVLASNRGSFGYGDATAFAGHLGRLVYGDNANHQDGTRARQVAEAMVEMGLVRGILDPLGRLSKISFPEDNAISVETDGTHTDDSLNVDPWAILSRYASDLAIAQAELEERKKDKEYLDSLAAENEELASRAELAENRVVELEARPEPEHLKTRIAELEAELARERATSKAAEISARNLRERLEAERSEHIRTEEILGRTRAVVSEQGEILGEIASALGADKLPVDKIPKVIKEAGDRFKNEAGQETYDSMMDVLHAFGFKQAESIVERFFTADDEEAVRARDLIQELNEVDVAMEGLPSKSARKYNRLVDEHNALFDELSVLVNKWLGSKTS